VHQDVKPGNVLLSPDGIAKVGVFGLANARRVSGEGATVAARADQSILAADDLRAKIRRPIRVPRGEQDSVWAVATSPDRGSAEM